MIRVLVALLLAGTVAPQALGLETAPVITKRTTATLITGADSVQPGGTVRIALRLRMADGWHTYWRNPGEAGVPTEVTPVLSAGATSGPIAWPMPERLSEGSITTYGYTGEVVLPVTVTLAPGVDAVAGTVTANWLVCEDICVPEEATFHVSLPTGSATPSAELPLFQAHDRAMPRAAPWPATIAADGTLSVRARELNASTVAGASFIPGEPDEIVDHDPQTLTAGDGGFTLGLHLAKGFVPTHGLRGVLSVRDRGGLETDVALTASEAAIPPVAGGAEIAPVAGGAQIAPAADGVPTQPISREPAPALTAAGEPGPGKVSLIRALAFAFLGGVILNLMPCVFPILAMKTVGFAAGLARGRARAHAVSYTSGVVATFICVALALLAARAAGTAAGWGFQFASPVFVAAMAWLVFAVGLNLSGVFRIGAGFAGAGGGLAAREGHWGSFFTGALAVLVATPCTAPFMGVAITAGLAAPPPVTMLIFLVMGLGLASPYLLLSLIPGLARIIPRPGPWMDILKQLLAFPMYGAAVWLLWVVSQEAGAPGVLGTATGFVLLGFAAWSLGVTQDRSVTLRRTGWLGAGVAVLLAMLSISGIGSMPAGQSAARDSETFTPGRLATLRAEGRPVFVNLTAAWCVTCLLNERVAISNDSVQAAFVSKHVAYLRGDWTRQDPSITAFLRENGRDGVPLYLYYAPHAASAQVLPQILTATSVLEAVDGQS